MKNFRSNVCRAGRQIARKIRIPPRITKAINGYKDHPKKREIWKVILARNSVKSISPPKAMLAPPKM